MTDANENIPHAITHGGLKDSGFSAPKTKDFPSEIDNVSDKKFFDRVPRSRGAYDTCGGSSRNRLASLPAARGRGQWQSPCRECLWGMSRWWPPLRAEAVSCSACHHIEPAGTLTEQVTNDKPCRGHVAGMSRATRSARVVLAIYPPTSNQALCAVPRLLNTVIYALVVLTVGRAGERQLRLRSPR